MGLRPTHGDESRISKAEFHVGCPSCVTRDHRSLIRVSEARKLKPQRTERGIAATKTVGRLSLSAVGNRFSQKPRRSRILKSYSFSGTGLTQDLRRSPSAYHYRFIPKPNNDTEENAMQEFIAKHQDKIAAHSQALTAWYFEDTCAPSATPRA